MSLILLSPTIVASPPPPVLPPPNPEPPALIHSNFRIGSFRLGVIVQGPR